MPEKPKKKPESEINKSEEPDDPSWSEDQKRHEYYYDDAHGYEVYKPDEDAEKDVE